MKMEDKGRKLPTFGRYRTGDKYFRLYMGCIQNFCNECKHRERNSVKEQGNWSWDQAQCNLHIQNRTEKVKLLK